MFKKLLGTLLLTSLIISTPVYADVKVVADDVYAGDVQNISSSIKNNVPKQIQDALEQNGGFVWLKPLASASNLNGYVIEANPTINPNVTRLSVMQECGHFTRQYNNVNTSSLSLELSKYQALWKDSGYSIPELYSTDALYDTVFAAYCLHNLEPMAGSILNTCPTTLALIEENIRNTTTTVTVSIKTNNAISSNAPAVQRPSTGTSTRTSKVPTTITWGD